MSIHLLVNRNDLQVVYISSMKSSWNREIRIRLQVIRIHQVANRSDLRELCMFHLRRIIESELVSVCEDDIHPLENRNDLEVEYVSSGEK